MTKIFHFMRKVTGLYNAEKLLMCEAQFVRAHNTAGIDADTQSRAPVKRQDVCI